MRSLTTGWCAQAFAILCLPLVALAQQVPLPVGSGANLLTYVNGTVFFTANDGIHGLELWKSDGTAAGTVLVKDIYPGAAGAGPTGLTNVDGTLFFSADDGIHGNELWKSDGTAEGTVLVKDINPAGNSSAE